MASEVFDPREVALQRFELIVPLLDPDLDKAERALRREAILAAQKVKGQTRISPECAKVCAILQREGV